MENQTTTKNAYDQEVKKPDKYKVVFINDDYTPFDFVALMLMKYFGKSKAEAIHFAQEVHSNGKGIAGVYTYDIARTKSIQVNAHSLNAEFPLKTTIEKE